MSKLEDIVPPLELCRKIPKGDFGYSVLTWNEGYVKGNFVIEQRGLGRYYICPAPTLPEILLAIDEAGGYCPSCRYQAKWQLGYADGPLDSELTELFEEEDRDNPAAAALKLWLDVNKLDRTDKTNKTDKEK